MKNLVLLGSESMTMILIMNFDFQAETAAGHIVGAEDARSPEQVFELRRVLVRLQRCSACGCKIGTWDACGIRERLGAAAPTSLDEFRVSALSSYIRVPNSTLRA